MVLKEQTKRSPLNSLLKTLKYKVWFVLFFCKKCGKMCNFSTKKKKTNTGEKNVQNQFCFINKWNVNYLLWEASSKRDILNCVNMYIRTLKEPVEAVLHMLNEGLSCLKFHSFQLESLIIVNMKCDLMFHDLHLQENVSDTSTLLGETNVVLPVFSLL